MDPVAEVVAPVVADSKVATEPALETKTEIKAAPPTRESVIHAEKLKLLKEKSENKGDLDLAKSFKAAQKAAQDGDIDKLLEFAQVPADKAASYLKKKFTPQDKVAVLDDKVAQLQAQIHKQETARQAEVEKKAHQDALQTLEDAKAEIPWVMALQGGKDEVVSYLKQHEAETGERITLMESAKLVNERFKSGMAEQIEEILALPEGELMFKNALEKMMAKQTTTTTQTETTPAEQATQALKEAVKPPETKAKASSDGLTDSQREFKALIKKKSEDEKAKKAAAIVAKDPNQGNVRQQEVIPTTQYKPNKKVDTNEWLRKKGFL